ncbi:MAG TPA: SDR family NAD(P)-dependent oxidoreductase [Anaerolineae bacterium]|nr:SDR family NAD(P)-dependent oxidoreductase [Anaerolineae bacterium]HQK13109.1 SDR family NAD(P)-dependent oxidoreductase [Anaerolineae bacterium]
MMSEANPCPASRTPTPPLPTSIFITGATGFIGRRLTEQLVAAGADVTALTLPEEVPWVPQGVRVLPGDITDATSVQRAISAAQPTLIIHLAAVGITNPHLPFTTACRVNVDGVINVLDAARTTSGVRRIVLVGSSYEYGARRTEDGLDPFNAYSASKVAAWAFARAAYNAWGAPVVWVRLFQVYGPGQREQALIPAAIRAALSDADFRMTAGAQQRDFVFVEDVVAGLLAVAAAPAIEGRALDIAAGQLYRIRDVVERIWALSGARGRILAGALPYRPGEVPAIPADVDRTRRLTGWEARVGLEEGLRKTIDWTREH